MYMYVFSSHIYICVYIGLTLTRVRMNKATISFFYRAVEPDSLIAVQGEPEPLT